MSSTKKRERGFTLVEVLIATVMAAMFFGLLYSMFLPALGIASAGSAKTDTQSSATTALYQLEADLRVSTTAGITVGSTPATPVPSLGSSAETQVVAVEVPEKFVGTNDNFGQSLYDSGTGLPNFETYAVWALIPAQNGSACSTTNPCALYRTTYDTGAASTAANPIDATTLSTITSNIQTNGRLMVRNVTSFEVANQTIACTGCLYPNARPELDLEIATQSQDTNGNLSQSSFQTQVFDRNK